MHISGEGIIGITLALLGMAGAGALAVAPEQIWIGWGLIALAAAGGVSLAGFQFCTNLRKRRGFVLVLLGTGLLIAGSIIGLVGAFQMDAPVSIAAKARADLTKNEGILVPANLPTPKLPQGEKVPADGIVAFYGGNISINAVFPYTILEMRGEPMIVIDRDPKTKNLIVTTLRIFDDRDNIIARIDEEGFWVENSARRKRPDEHTLIVYDHNDQRFLRINFINPQTISIEGVFRHPRSKLQFVMITEKEMTIMPARITISGNVSRAKAMISM